MPRVPTSAAIWWTGVAGLFILSVLAGLPRPLLPLEGVQLAACSTPSATRGEPAKR